MNSFALPLRLALKNPKKFRQYLLHNKRELSYWGLLLAGIATIYFAFSDGEFSFFYTLSAIVQGFGFLIIALKVLSAGSVSGLSLNTFICYSVSLLSRLYAITFYQGYRPSDASGDLVFRASTGLAFVASFVMVLLIKGKFNKTYNGPLDKINFLFLVVPALALSCLVHPTLNDEYGGDISWTFALYLEIVAMLPQLYMLSKKGGEIEAVTSHFVASQGFSLCLGAVFWLGCYAELNETVGRSWTLLANHTGTVIMFCQVIQILFFSDFLYEYIKSVRRGLPMTLNQELV